MKRGEIWWAEVDKRRPVVLLSRNEAYGVRANVTVAPITTTVRGFAVEVVVGKKEGLPKRGVVNCDSIVTISKSLLVARVGNLSASKRSQLDQALLFALGLDDT